MILLLLLVDMDWVCSILRQIYCQIIAACFPPGAKSAGDCPKNDLLGLKMTRINENNAPDCGMECMVPNIRRDKEVRFGTYCILQKI